MIIYLLLSSSSAQPFTCTLFRGQGSTSTSLLLDARRQPDHKQKAKVVENDMKQVRKNKRILTTATEATPSRSKEMPMRMQ